MPESLKRIQAHEVSEIVNKHIGHWELLETETGAPFLLFNGASHAHLTERLAAWDELNTRITTALTVDSPHLYAERMFAWGENAADSGSPWFWLGFYGRCVRAALPKGHLLLSTLPKMGTPTIGAIPGLFQEFLRHWDRVNTALTALGKPPLVMGDPATGYSRAKLEAAQTLWLQKQAEIDELQGNLPDWRAERVQVLGDVSEEERDPDSIVALLHSYHIAVQTRSVAAGFAGSLPRIFPKRKRKKDKEAETPVAAPVAAPV